MSYKVSPFYRYVKDQYQDFLIGPGFVSSIPTGNETAYGVEFQFRKGDPSRNGLSEQLSYTYTNAFFKLRRFSNGSTVITPVNATIDQFNALTSTGSRSGQKGAPCYVPAANAGTGRLVHDRRRRRQHARADRRRRGIRRRQRQSGRHQPVLQHGGATAISTRVACSRSTRRFRR